MAQIEFSEEQNMLLDTAGEFCKTHASIEPVSYTHLTLPTKA